jgi:Cof subfamily protein (haloacid dehalogenase superfamily)
MIRLLALDIDGTLLDSNGHLPEANLNAIVQAMAQGVEVALATGRRFDFARPVFELLPSPLTLVLSNGAVVKTREGETLMRRLLPRAIAREVLDAVPQHRHEASVTFDRPREGQVVYEAIDWDHPRHQTFFETNRPFLAEMNPLHECLTEDPVQVMFSGGCVEMRALFNELRGGDRYSVALTEYEFRDLSLVDVLRAGCCKGTALADWARARGYAPSEVMAVGDNLNDIEMLEFAGRPVVMGNAIPDLRDRGWPITTTNDEEGVARAVETFILGRAS